MRRTLEHRIVRGVRTLTGLRGRREFHALVLYLGAAWLLYQFISLLALTFELPLVVVRASLVVLVMGALGVLPLARWYEIIAREVDEGRTPEGNVPGVPDFLEGVLARLYRRVRPRTAALASGVAAVGFTGAFLFLWNQWAESHEVAATDHSIAVAVFPFTTAGLDDPTFGEAVADLLAATLDGTPGIRVADPATLWQPLRAGPSAPLRSPSGEDARRLGERYGAVRNVTGTVVGSGDRLEFAARVSGGRAAPGGSRMTGLGAAPATAALTVGVPADSLSMAIRRLAIDIVATVWPRDHLPTVPEIERFATSDPDALKAYLEAKGYVRRGEHERALVAIERAVALDSTFALAHLEHFSIQSMLLWLNNEPFVGIREIIERAMRHRDRLTPRNRLRVEASLALDDTDGVRAEFLLQRILFIDPLDVEALHTLAFTYLRDGWQMGKGMDEVIAAYDRVLAVDSASLIGRTTRAKLDLERGELESAGDHLEHLGAADTASVFVAGVVGAHRLLAAEDSERNGVLRELAGEPAPVVLSVIRHVRGVRPDLAKRFLLELQADTMPVFHQRIGRGGLTQLWFAEGSLQKVDSVLATGALDMIRPVVNRYFVTAHLAGVGQSASAERAARELAAYAPADSLELLLDHRPQLWAAGWAVAAYHAALGDTLQARVWQRALAALPQGETRWDWTGSLAADIEARLAARRGDLERAAREAELAYDLWLLHPAGFTLESDPEPAIRFHLAAIRRAGGDLGRAEPLYRSFGPPHTWLGFYTARAALELGGILEERGEWEAAARQHQAAARLWEGGNAEIVGPWLERAREGLGRSNGEAGNVRTTPRRADASGG
jgi:hypothetical protein